jgi:hypothetical protein
MSAAALTGCLAAAPQDASTSALDTPAVAPISPESAAKLPAELLTAITDVRARAATNQIPRVQVFDYAVLELFATDPAAKASGEASIRAALTAAGLDADALLSASALEPYEDAVRRSADRTGATDDPTLRLGRSGEQAFDEDTFLNCVDYARATAHRAVLAGMSPDDLRFFWTMDNAGYLQMCPSASGQAAQGSRPLVHAMVAFRKDGAWFVLNAETNLASPDLEVFTLGGDFPQRLGAHYRVDGAPLVRGLDLVYAGVSTFEDPLVAGPVSPNLLKDMTASGQMSTSPADFVCR